MSSELPILADRDVIRAFIRAGFVQQPGRGKGSHAALFDPRTRRLLIIPCHGDVKRGTLRALIRQADMTVDEFRSHLR